MATLLQDKYEARKAEVNARFEQLRTNEEELNRIRAQPNLCQDLQHGG